MAFGSLLAIPFTTTTIWSRLAVSFLSVPMDGSTRIAAIFWMVRAAVLWLSQPERVGPDRLKRGRPYGVGPFSLVLFPTKQLGIAGNKYSYSRKCKLIFARTRRGIWPCACCTQKLRATYNLCVPTTTCACRPQNVTTTYNLCVPTTTCACRPTLGRPIPYKTYGIQMIQDRFPQVVHRTDPRAKKTPEGRF